MIISRSRCFLKQIFPGASPDSLWDRKYPLRGRGAIFLLYSASRCHFLYCVCPRGSQNRGSQNIPSNPQRILCSSRGDLPREALFLMGQFILHTVGSLPGSVFFREYWHGCYLGSKPAWQIRESASRSIFLNNSRLRSLHQCGSLMSPFIQKI